MGGIPKASNEQGVPAVDNPQAVLGRVQGEAAFCEARPGGANLRVLLTP